MMARSASVIGALNTRQGRTFAVIPRSTSHTSPRDALGMVCLAAVEFQKSFFGRADKFLVGQRRRIESLAALDNFGGQFPLVSLGKCIIRFKKRLHS